MQIGQFTLPKYGTEVRDESREARYIRSNKEVLPVHHVRFLVFWFLCFLFLFFFFFLMEIICMLVVPDGVLWGREQGWCEWAFLPCFWNGAWLFALESIEG